MDSREPAPQRRRLGWAARLYLWTARRLYAELSWAYDAVSWLVSAGAWSRWRLIALEYAAEDSDCGRPRVLEIGFGTGELLLAMAAKQWDVFGLEPSAAMHRVTMHKLRRRGVAVPRVRAQAQSIPFSLDSFDAVVSTFPAEYIADPSTLAEIARVLKASVAEGRAGGRLVVVGIGVSLNHPVLRRLAPIFYGSPSPAFAQRWREMAEGVGLSTRTVMHSAGWATLPILIAEKRGRDERTAC
jgi:ubiquinone/menaquinone biosynthesis C-methylase UbiE